MDPLDKVINVQTRLGDVYLGLTQLESREEGDGLLTLAQVIDLQRATLKLYRMLDEATLHLRKPHNQQEG